MALTRHRVSRGAAAAALSAALLLGGAACGFNAQTLQPYTPAEGVNLNVGEAANSLPAVQIRNLMVLTREEGTGFISATLIPNEDDQLLAISGTPLKVGGEAGSAFNATLNKPIALGAGSLVVLTDGEQITVNSPDLQAGLEAKLTLQFEHSGAAEVTVPVVDADQAEYKTVTPTPAATPSA